MITLNSKNIKKVADKAKKVNVDLYVEMSDPSTEARTEKGAKSYSVSGDPRVDLFFKSVRDMPCAYLEFLLDECWKVSPLDTLRLGFYIRDCRGGKGEKALFCAFCQWLLRYHPLELETNAQYFPFFGSWKDLLQVFLGTSSQDFMVKVYTSQLKSDLTLLGTDHENDITLAAKYAPSEKGAFDRKFTAVTKFCNELGVNKATYRRKYLRPLRTKINTVEEMMCSGRWGEIDYSKVPSVASGRYRKAFTKHDPKRYQKYLNRVIKGEVKMNTGVLHPHEIAKVYVSRTIRTEVDLTAEAQWTQFIKDQRSRRAKLENSVEMLAIVDVSGSMYGSIGSSIAPISVSLSLGVLIAELNSKKSPFYRKWITFSKSPKMETLRGETLCEIFQHMDKCHWDMSTRLQPVFDLILTTAVAFSVPPEKMPRMLVILSDMQFDAACPDNSRTNWEEFDRKYREAGYERPVIVFWNLRGNTLDFPVTDKVSGTALVSGFSASTLGLLMDGNVPNPYQVMRKAIDNPRYARITLQPPILDQNSSTPIKEIIKEHVKNVQN